MFTFNPLSPCGERNLRLTICFMGIISIHSLHTERDRSIFRGVTPKAQVLNVRSLYHIQHPNSSKGPLHIRQTYRKHPFLMFIHTDRGNSRRSSLLHSGKYRLRYRLNLLIFQPSPDSSRFSPSSFLWPIRRSAYRDTESHASRDPQSPQCGRRK